MAFVVSCAIGLDTNTASADYIQLYHGDKEALVQSRAVEPSNRGVREAARSRESLFEDLLREYRERTCVAEDIEDFLAF